MKERRERGKDGQRERKRTCLCIRDYTKKERGSRKERREGKKGIKISYNKLMSQKISIR